MITVYTCILKGKDSMVSMPKEPGVRYVCFSDKPFKHDTWLYHPIDLLGQQDPRRVARRYKVLSHIYFPNCSTIWIDGRVQLRHLPSEYFKSYGGDLCARPHPNRNCIYQEGEQVKKQNYEDPAVVDAQMKKYKAAGYPPMNGLNETGILLRRPIEAVERFNSAWWVELATGSKRDQLSFNYTAWHMRQPIMQIQRDDVIVNKHRIPTDVNR